VGEGGRVEKVIDVCKKEKDNETDEVFTKRQLYC